MLDTRRSEHVSARFRPAFLPTFAAFAGIVVFVVAGNWQRGRMEQKLDLGAQLAAAEAAAPVALPVTDAWTAWRFRPVYATGIFDAQRQILLDNKVYQGRVGYEVVTPFALADGRVVLVDRGWVAAAASRSDLPAVPPPSGAVTVQGRVNSPPGAYIELQRTAPVGPVWQNLDLPRFTQVTGLSVLPVLLEQTAPTQSGDSLVRDWPAPDLGVDKHRIYMVQWYAFAAMAAGLWLYFTIRAAR